MSGLTLFVLYVITARSFLTKDSISDFIEQSSVLTLVTSDGHVEQIRSHTKRWNYKLRLQGRFFEERKSGFERNYDGVMSVTAIGRFFNAIPKLGNLPGTLNFQQMDIASYLAVGVCQN